jgi:hypothetical protein
MTFYSQKMIYDRPFLQLVMVMELRQLERIQALAPIRKDPGPNSPMT